MYNASSLERIYFAQQKKSFETNSKYDLLRQEGDDPFLVETHLLHRVAVADRDRVVFKRLKVHRDAVGGPDLVLTAVPLADRPRLVVDDGEALLEIVPDFPCLRRKIFLKGQDRRLVCRDRGVEVEHVPRLAVRKGLFLVRLAENGEHESVRPDRVFDDVGDEPRSVHGIDVLQTLSRIFLMAGEVVVRAVVDAVQLLPAHRIEILDIARFLCIVCEFFMVMEAEMFFLEAEVEKELLCLLLVFPIKFLVRPFLAEPLMFHLFELDGAEDEVAGGDLVAERLADLGDAEGDFRPRRALDVEEIDEFALRRLGTEIDLVLALVGDPARGLEHEIEGADGGPVKAAADGAMDLMFADILLHFLVRHAVGIDASLGMRFDEVVRTVTGLAFLAVHFGIGEGRRVPACFPNSRVHENGGVQPVGVFALLHEPLPPCAFDVVLDLDADGTVIPRVSHAAVDLASREDDAPRLAERHQFLHCDRAVVHNRLR